MSPSPANPDPQSETIAFLARPDTHGVATVDIERTHISIVFLAGPHAIKLKRAVRTSYLDYSNLERRRAACEAELAVNRRFAPALYHGIAPIRRAPDGTLHLGEALDGEIIDWVVLMARFPAEDQLDRIAESRGISAEIALALATRIAALHDSAERRPENGGLHALKAVIEDKAEGLGAARGNPFPPNAIAAFLSRAREICARLGPLLEARRRNGSVRACHGDLHLRNIALIDGVPTPFDAIEFDPALSSIDVLYDLAFLLMDLHVRGLDAAGSLILNRYLDLRAEEDGLAALPLFLSVRAAIRAETLAAAARQAESAEAATKSRDQASTYLDLANRLLEPHAPRLVAVGGLSGTGKSTLAATLAPSLSPVPGARILRTDVLRKRARGVSLDAKLPADAYTPSQQAAVYDDMLRTARVCLQGGHSVILDAVFARPAEHQAAEALAASASVPFQGVWLTAPLDRLIRRIESRTGDPSDATANVVRRQAE